MKLKYGVCLSNYGKEVDLETLRATTMEAEKLGYDSIWLTDHILMPENSGTVYGTILETMTTLGYLAAVTSKVKLGISSLVMALRNPVIVAKQLATIDYLSGGRVTLATGAGWNEDEYSILGSNFHNRGKRLDESIRLIKSLWRGDKNFESKVIRQHFDSQSFEPRPVQKELFIWIGGNSKAAMRRARTLGDGWHADGSPPALFRKLVSEFRAIDGPSKAISTRLAFNSRAKDTIYKGAKGDDQLMLSSNFEEDRSILEEFEKLGVSLATIEIDYNGATSREAQIENLRTFASKFIAN
ncbi:MAG: TIGR03619 family F420-dependent LLM class oxidoreductase [archaeon]|nr:TIGR03619 family F420-dependent LLM class oxidoreductase [archaeon]